MLRFLPFLAILVLASFLFYNPSKIALNSSHPKTITSPSENLPSDYNLDEVLSTTGEFDYEASEAVFNNQPVNYPKQKLVQALSDQLTQESVVLGTTNAAGEEKWIEVDLAKQLVTAWEGTKNVRQYLVSTGLWNSTRKGTFYIWYKTRSQKMSGGSKEDGTYYYLPNVPHNMFYDGERALHGAYWHNNFGHVMSHGCVNEPLDQAAWIFEWAGPVLPPGVNILKASAENPGTRVWVH